jgi:hypothetical protein
MRDRDSVRLWDFERKLISVCEKVRHLGSTMVSCGRIDCWQQGTVRYLVSLTAHVELYVGSMRGARECQVLPPGILEGFSVIQEQCNYCRCRCFPRGLSLVPGARVSDGQ